MAVAVEDLDARARILADTGLRRSLERYVRSKVQGADVDDLVQATLADALEAPNAPENAEELARWVRGIARHKIADLYRGRRHQVTSDGNENALPSEDRAPHSARDLLRWAHRELPEGMSEDNTFEWMLREGSGEKLEDIAKEQGIPAPRIRQRVSRMRRFFRQRWEAQLAALALLAAVAAGAFVLLRDTSEQPRISREDWQELEPARELRERALQSCDAKRWNDCLRLLDEAASLDPKGDRSQRVEQARAAAKSALARPEPSETPLAPAPPKSEAPVESSTPPVNSAPPPRTEQRAKPPSPKTSELPFPQNVAPKPTQPAPAPLSKDGEPKQRMQQNRDDSSSLQQQAPVPTAPKQEPLTESDWATKK